MFLVSPSTTRSRSNSASSVDECALLDVLGITSTGLKSTHSSADAADDRALSAVLGEGPIRRKQDGTTQAGGARGGKKLKGTAHAGGATCADIGDGVSGGLGGGLGDGLGRGGGGGGDATLFFASCGDSCGEVPSEHATVEGPHDARTSSTGESRPKYQR